jgi:hypothetical protein
MHQLKTQFPKKKFEMGEKRKDEKINRETKQEGINI